MAGDNWSILFIKSLTERNKDKLVARDQRDQLLLSFLSKIRNIVVCPL